jgi:BirA family biotin operon repressor/biotin-[acetyl-CoA-carboxylase] ligase
VNLDAQILHALRNSVSVSGAELADRAGVSRAAVWARIEELRSLGYEIAANPHQGYRLIATPDALHADDLLARLGEGALIGRDIRVFNETASTNDVIGRLGRQWLSPPARGLWFSVLLRPEFQPLAATRITVAAATALCRAVKRETGAAVAIKWPNDLLIEGKKIAGILTELSAEVDRINHVTLGIGVDVNLTASELPAELREIATSLRIATGRRIDRPALACAVLQELENDYLRIIRGGFTGVAEEWESQCLTLGRRVSITLGGHRIEGLAESLDDEGALMVRTSHGQLERVTGGDVTLEK